jgi:hypothetical protein
MENESRKRPSGRKQPPRDDAREQKQPPTSPETLRLMRSVEHPGEFSADTEERVVHPPPAEPRKRRR